MEKSHPSLLSFGFAFWPSTFSPKHLLNCSFWRSTFSPNLLTDVWLFHLLRFVLHWLFLVAPVGWPFWSCSFFVFLFSPLLLHCIWVFVYDFSLLGCSLIQACFFLGCFCCPGLSLLPVSWAFYFVFCFLFILGALHAIIFFALVFILLWTEKRCDLCLILMLWTSVCLAFSVVWPLCSFLCLTLSTLCFAGSP